MRAGRAGSRQDESAQSEPSESASNGAYAKGGAKESTSENAAAGETSLAAAPISVGEATGVGKVLVDENGMTLYYFEKDVKGSGKSTCSGACASAWPPLLTGGEPEGMSGVQASMLGTIERSDGTMQATYAGWPLYTFVEDTKPGEDNGTDSKAFGASWYPLHPDGHKAGH
jgi:predicted lipoprotein with Yx(FWY)xxD motif